MKQIKFTAPCAVSRSEERKKER